MPCLMVVRPVAGQCRITLFQSMGCGACAFLRVFDKRSWLTACRPHLGLLTQMILIVVIVVPIYIDLTLVYLSLRYKATWKCCDLFDPLIGRTRIYKPRLL